MAHLLISNRFYSHGAVIACSDAAVGLWVKAGCWSARHLTDGFIPTSEVRRQGATRAAGQLVRHGLWEPAPGGWRMLRAVPAAPGCHPIPLWKIQRDDVRPRIPAAVRRAVFARDGHACVECRATADLSLDHIFPWSLGGPDTVANLRVLCRPCNSSKGAKV